MHVPEVYQVYKLSEGHCFEHVSLPIPSYSLRALAGMHLVPIFGSQVMDHSGQPCLKHGMEQVWANYIAKWIQSYRVRNGQAQAATATNQ